MRLSRLAPGPGVPGRPGVPAACLARLPPPLRVRWGAMATRPDAVAFDVIETLMPLEPLRERFTAAGLPAHLLELWFTRTLRDGIALAATGDYAPFGEVAAQALRIVSGYRA